MSISTTSGRQLMTVWTGSIHPGRHLGETVTSITAWVVLPAAVGLYRSVRREVK
jgi:hypothetical protein